MDRAVDLLVEPTFLVNRWMPGLQPMPSSPRRRAPSSVSSVSIRKASPIQRGLDDPPALEDEPRAHDLVADTPPGTRRTRSRLRPSPRPASRTPRRPACYGPSSTAPRRVLRARGSGRCPRRRSAPPRRRRRRRRSAASLPRRPSRAAPRRRRTPRTHASDMPASCAVACAGIRRSPTAPPSPSSGDAAAAIAARARVAARRRDRAPSRVFSGAEIVDERVALRPDPPLQRRRRRAAPRAAPRVRTGRRSVSKVIWSERLAPRRAISSSTASTSGRASGVARTRTCQPG